MVGIGNTHISGNMKAEGEQADFDVAKLMHNVDALTKEQKFTIFKSLLQQFGIGSNWKWEDANRVIQTDTLKRYIVYKSMGERRQAFTDYQSELRIKERGEMRESRDQAKQQFYNLLEENKF